MVAKQNMKMIGVHAKVNVVKGPAFVQCRNKPKQPVWQKVKRTPLNVE
jgi:hypothetical protein